MDNTLLKSESNTKLKKNAIHNIKTLPEYYNAVESGVKTFEIRKNDRNYQVGDFLNLHKWDGEYLDESQTVEITYITDYEQAPGYVVMSIVRLFDENETPNNKVTVQDIRDQLGTLKKLIGDIV